MSKCIGVIGSQGSHVVEGTYKYGMEEGKKELRINWDWRYGVKLTAK